MRIARPTNDLDAVVRFYRDGVGLEVLFRFEGHDGFDGVMLGRAGEPYHLEFTRERGVRAPAAPSAEHLLVFYLPDAARWRAAVDRMRGLGLSPVKSHNPYWDRKGETFEDPEGYRVVFYQGAWRA